MPRRRPRGQSVVEFAILVPVMLAFLGATIDIARVFQTWITLNAAVRDAAEYTATSSSAANAQVDGARVVCLQTKGLSGFTKSALAAPNDVEKCTWPSVTVTWASSTTAPGATTKYPIATSTVRANFDFRPLFNYPFITNDGVWSLSVRQTFSIVQGRTN